MNGEGFAFFRFHCLRWGDEATCISGPQAWCTDIWRDMQRRRPCTFPDCGHRDVTECGT